MADKKSLIKGTLTFTLSTFTSRIFGYIRDLLFAKYFGATGYTDSFFVAIRIPNAFRELLGENTLFPAFVPFLYELEKDKKAFREFINSSFVTIAIISGIITLLGIISTPILVKIMAPGLARYENIYNLTVTLTRISFLYVFFLSLTVIESSILYYKKNFFYFSFSPVLLNISIIIFIMLHKNFREPLLAPTVGWVIGGIAQFLFIKYGTIRYGITSVPIAKPFRGKVKEAVKLMVPASIGTATYQLNLFVDMVLASILPKASISILYYANRIFLLPLSLFAVSLGNVFLPHASELVVKNDRKNLFEQIRFALFLVLFINLPITIFIIHNRNYIIDILYRRGKFSIDLVEPVSFTLAMYSLGLPFYSIQKVLTSIHQAHKDLATPRKSALLSVMSNALFGYILLHFLSQGGIALATTISSIIQVTFLTYKLKDKNISLIEIIPSIRNLRILAINLIICTISALISNLIVYDFKKPFIDRTITFVEKSLIFFVPYALLLFIVMRQRSHLKSRQIS